RLQSRATGPATGRRAPTRGAFAWKMSRSAGNGDQTVINWWTDRPKHLDFRPDFDSGAEGGIRTPTVLRPPAPQAGASASSATSALREVRLPAFAKVTAGPP